MTIYHTNKLDQIIGGGKDPLDKCEWCGNRITDHIIAVKPDFHPVIDFIFTVCNSCVVKYKAPTGHHMMAAEWYHRKKELKVFGGYDGGT